MSATWSFSSLLSDLTPGDKIYKDAAIKSGSYYIYDKQKTIGEQSGNPDSNPNYYVIGKNSSGKPEIGDPNDQNFAKSINIIQCDSDNYCQLAMTDFGCLAYNKDLNTVQYSACVSNDDTLWRFSNGKIISKNKTNQAACITVGTKPDNSKFLKVSTGIGDCFTNNTTTWTTANDLYDQQLNVTEGQTIIDSKQMTPTGIKYIYTKQDTSLGNKYTIYNSGGTLPNVEYKLGDASIVTPVKIEFKDCDSRNFCKIDTTGNYCLSAAGKNMSKGTIDNKTKWLVKSDLCSNIDLATVSTELKNLAKWRLQNDGTIHSLTNECISYTDQNELVISDCSIAVPNLTQLK
jgi:hypothetical protein